MTLTRSSANKKRLGKATPDQVETRSTLLRQACQSHMRDILLEARPNKETPVSMQPPNSCRQFTNQVLR